MSEPKPQEQDYTDHAANVYGYKVYVEYDDGDVEASGLFMVDGDESVLWSQEPESSSGKAFDYDAIKEAMVDLAWEEVNKREGNTPLSQAAPALLQALKATRAALAGWIEIAEEHDQRDGDHLALAEADQAIQKAEGGNKEQT